MPDNSPKNLKFRIMGRKGLDPVREAVAKKSRPHCEGPRSPGVYLYHLRVMRREVLKSCLDEVPTFLQLSWSRSALHRYLRMVADTDERVEAQ